MSYSWPATPFLATLYLPRLRITFTTPPSYHVIHGKTRSLIGLFSGLLFRLSVACVALTHPGRRRRDVGTWESKHTNNGKRRDELRSVSYCFRFLILLSFLFYLSSVMRNLEEKNKIELIFFFFIVLIKWRKC